MKYINEKYIEKYVLTISEELYEKLPDYTKTSIYWAYRYCPETKTGSYATICDKTGYKILVPFIDYIIEKEKMNEGKEGKKEKR